jgi:regulator of protease activity HflC (stomatin/prohibitin superfamily)
MDQTQAQAEAEAQAQAQAQAQARAEAQAQAARAELEAYVTPELLDRDTDRRHRSFLSVVLGEDVGHVRCRTTRMLLPIHDRWVPKYVN